MAPTEKKPTRMEKYRTKLKSDPEKWKQYLMKERERDKARRLQFKEKIGKDKRLKEQNRKKIRDRVRLHRQKLKLQKSSSSTGTMSESPLGSFKCPQSLGKAVNKVRQMLPSSPSKKAAVVKKLAVEVIGSHVLTHLHTSKRGPKTLSPEARVCVQNFLCSDEISRQAPGKQDVKSVKHPQTGKRRLVQKRHMVMTVGEAYQEFKERHPEVVIGKSTFYSLQPQYVLPVSETPHNVCVCKYHSNVCYLLEALSKCIVKFPKMHKVLLTKLCCSITEEKCMMGVCSSCSNIDFEKLITHCKNEMKTTISWKQWESDDSGHYKLNTFSGYCENVLKLLLDKIPHFKIHCFVKKVQDNYFTACKNNLCADNAVIQIDFAENYAVVSQDEIQTAHWSHSQVTVFTCCVWLASGIVKSYVVVSDDLSHSKYAVWLFLGEIIKDIKKHFPSIKYLFIFSDNCASQFKNKYTLSNICYTESDYGVNTEWNFFASSHGKGAVDGIGGTVKRFVWIGVKAKRIQVATAKDFHDYIDKNLKGITSVYISKEQVVQTSESSQLYDRWQCVLPIPNIQSCHHFRVYDQKNLLIAKTAKSEMEKTSICYVDEDLVECCAPKTRLHYDDIYTDSETEHNTEECDIINASQSGIEKEDIHSGLFVLVQVSTQSKRARNENKYIYVGVCQGEIDDEQDVKIMFLKSCGNGKVFKSNETDVAFVNIKELISKLPTPEIKLKGNRIYYEFRDKINISEKVA
ncbi:uncharacterized protein LOC134541539 [Bacillus rossius redtenbacheri]|uniref:uncharacterized protein LOC134541539 n=1 Tax=Bacillus rossius redtenbacheri TaxID=93214 RepID=UPI002FDC83C8